MKVHEIARRIESIVPRGLALDWDNVGLLVGSQEQKVSKVLVTIDITLEVVEEAKRQKADMILSYHPVIWDGLKSVTPGGPGQVVYELMQAGIAVYSIHTAYDIAEGGTNDQLAAILGMKETRPIGDYVSPAEGDLYKVIVYVPREDTERVAQAMFEAGAGNIGHYDSCAFRGEGTGSFRPLEGATPAIGEKGQLEYVPEVKLESIVPERKVASVIEAMRKNHPYETPAFDVLRHYDMEGLYGLGRMGKLEKPMKVSMALEKIKKATGAKAAGIIGPKNRTIKTAAVCAGSCGKIIEKLITGGCDFYLTGEIKHHLALAAAEAGLTCVCLSHTVSERFALKKLIRELKKTLDNVTITQSRKDKDPFEWKQI